MRLRTLVATFAVVLAGLVASPATAGVATVDGHAAASSVASCTHTSSGSCIRGGQFCPQSQYGHSGWDSHGRRYVCKGSRSHPHWMLP